MERFCLFQEFSPVGMDDGVVLPRMSLGEPNAEEDAQNFSGASLDALQYAEGSQFRWPAGTGSLQRFVEDPSQPYSSPVWRSLNMSGRTLGSPHLGSYQLNNGGLIPSVSDYPCRRRSPDSETQMSSSSWSSRDVAIHEDAHQSLLVEPFARYDDDNRGQRGSYLPDYPSVGAFSDPFTTMQAGVSLRVVQHYPDRIVDQSFGEHEAPHHDDEFGALDNEPRNPLQGIKAEIEDVPYEAQILNEMKHDDELAVKAEVSSNPDLASRSPSPARTSRGSRRRSLKGASSPGRSDNKRTTHSRTPSDATSARVRKTHKPKNKAAVSNGGHKRLSDAGVIFLCPFAQYKCDKTFGSKNEWKRHVSTQHIRLEYWRCHMCQPGTDGAYNDFNRKDLFTQHLRRMHSRSGDGQQAPKSNQKTIAMDDATLANHQKRSHCILRSPPRDSGCLFCTMTFTGDDSWEERMEHVAAHMEGKRKSDAQVHRVETWFEDSLLESWLLKEHLLELDEKGALCLTSAVAR